METKILKKGDDEITVDANTQKADLDHFATLGYVDPTVSKPEAADKVAGAGEGEGESGEKKPTLAAVKPKPGEKPATEKPEAADKVAGA